MASGGILGLNWEGICDIYNVYNLYEQANSGGKYVGTVNLENEFYTNKQEKYTKEYMMSESFVKELNDYIENGGIETKDYCKWKLNDKKQVVLDYSKVWDGTTWK